MTETLNRQAKHIWFNEYFGAFLGLLLVCLIGFGLKNGCEFATEVVENLVIMTGENEQTREKEVMN